jgi:hypothetical protein
MMYRVFIPIVGLQYIHTLTESSTLLPMAIQSDKSESCTIPLTDETAGIESSQPNRVHP